MSSLLLAIAAIAALCGPRVQGEDSMGKIRAESKKCQVEMLKCMRGKQLGGESENLAACMAEIK